MTPVVFVCSPLMVATAKGSGNPAEQCQSMAAGTSGRRRGALTEDISLVEAVGGDDWTSSVRDTKRAVSERRQALTSHAQVGLGRKVGHDVSGACLATSPSRRRRGDASRTGTRRRKPCTDRLDFLETVCLYVCLCTCLEEGPGDEGDGRRRR